jgi:cupin superfamily acireductone dioxygenase involved in methionine salvage
MIKMILRSVNDDKAFWLKTSDHDLVCVCHNLQELLDCLKKSSVDAVIFHMRDGRNDFEGWVSEVLGDQILARELKNIKAEDWVTMRHEIINKIKNRIKKITE